MSNYLLNLQSVRDSMVKLMTRLFFAFAAKLTARKKSLCGCRSLLALFQTDWKTSLTFLSRKKMGKFWHRTLPCPIYIQVILNLPFLIPRETCSRKREIWECEMRRGEGLWSPKTVEQRTKKYQVCHIKMNKKHRCPYFDNAV